MLKSIIINLKRNSIQKQIKERETRIDLAEVLKENEYCAEYFIMDLWGQFTNDINIGVANLEILAKNDIQRQLVFALDNLDLYNVKNKGSALYYKYMLFKNKVKPYLEEKNESNKLTPNVEKNDGEDEDL